MQPTTLLIISVTLVLSVSVLRAEKCYFHDYVLNSTDLVISCWDERNVQIVCKNFQSWDKFPTDDLQVQQADVEIRSCNFPRDVKLYNLTQSLGLISVNSVVFKDLESISTENLKNLTLASLQLSFKSFVKLPEDLLHNVTLEKFVGNLTALTRIPDGFFKNSKQLKELTIMNGNLESIKRADFAALEKLESLTLKNNKIADIENGTLDHLSNLRNIDISGNRLKTIPDEIFKNLDRLESIHLNGNEFTSLSPDLLQTKNNRLKKINLSYNYGGLEEILPDGFFKDLKELSCIKLAGNNISSLPTDMFLELESLATLDLSENLLSNLADDLFETNSQLRELRLSRNRLESIKQHTFGSLPLEKLYLDHNRLSGTANFLSGWFIIELNISHNNLTYIDRDFCNKVRSIQFLDLSHNGLDLELNWSVKKLQEESIFTGCNNLTVLNLSYNKIAKPGLLLGKGSPRSLKRVNLEGNQITSLDPYTDFMHVFGGIKINYQNNNITFVDFEILHNGKIVPSFFAERQKIEIELAGNPLNCDCKSESLLNHIHHKKSDQINSYLMIYTHNVTCQSPPELFNRTITSISLKELKCLVGSDVATDACKNTCSCWKYPHKEVLVVDCFGRNLSSVPEEVANDENYSIELNMMGNHLRETPALNHSYLLNVTALDLSSNNISQVTLGVFSKSLQVLKLHNNSISRLDSPVIRYLEDHGPLQNLTLHRNKWVCNCDARDFLKMVQNRTSIDEQHKIVCRNTDQRVSLMTEDTLCKTSGTTVKFAFAVIGLTGLLVGSLTGLYYKYQQHIKVWLYSRQLCLWFVTEEVLDKDKHYDAFISFSHHDEDFVTREIVKKLEETPNPYKLCLHYRDWVAGEWIPTQIANSVEQSRRTIVVLSPNFLESVWGRMEFRTAHNQAMSDGRARLIVIVYGDIGNADDLDPELQTYLSMNTYVKWGDPWFWDKLRYALPHRAETSKHKKHSFQFTQKHLSSNNRDGGAKLETVPMLHTNRQPPFNGNEDKLLFPEVY